MFAKFDFCMLCGSGVIQFQLKTICRRIIGKQSYLGHAFTATFSFILHEFGKSFQGFETTFTHGWDFTCVINVIINAILKIIMLKA